MAEEVKGLEGMRRAVSGMETFVRRRTWYGMVKNVAAYEAHEKALAIEASGGPRAPFFSPPRVRAYPKPTPEVMAEFRRVVCGPWFRGPPALVGDLEVAFEMTFEKTEKTNYDWHSSMMVVILAFAKMLIAQHGLEYRDAVVKAVEENYEGLVSGYEDFNHDSIKRENLDACLKFAALKSQATALISDLKVYVPQ